MALHRVPTTCPFSEISSQKKKNASRTPNACWRVILPLGRKIIEVERSDGGQNWQNVVRQYLQDIKKFKIVCDFAFTLYCDGYDDDEYCNIAIYSIEKYDEYLLEVLRSVGPWATHARVVCMHRNNFGHVLETCPRLEQLDIFSRHAIPLEQAVNCKALRKIHLSIFNIKDSPFDKDYVFKILTNESLEDVLITQADNRETRRLLGKTRSENLKPLQINHMKLTRLVLSGIDYTGIHLLLDTMPKLVELMLTRSYIPEKAEKGPVDYELANSIGRLSCLEVLDLQNNERASDALLAAAARGCQRLRSINVNGCPGVSGRAVVDACAALPSLYRINMENNFHVTRGEILAIVHYSARPLSKQPNFPVEWLTGEIPGRITRGALELAWSLYTPDSMGCRQGRPNTSNPTQERAKAAQERAKATQERAKATQERAKSTQGKKLTFEF